MRMKDLALVPTIEIISLFLWSQLDFPQFDGKASQVSVSMTDRQEYI